MHMYTCMWLCIYIYIYIYVHAVDKELFIHTFFKVFDEI